MRPMGVIGVARRLNDRLMSGATDGRTCAGAATCNAFVMWAAVAGLMSVDANNEKGTPTDDATSACANPDGGKLDVAGRAAASNFRTAIAAADAAADAARPAGAPARERDATLVDEAAIDGVALGRTASRGAAAKGERPSGTAEGSRLSAATGTEAYDVRAPVNSLLAIGKLAACRRDATEGAAAKRDTAGPIGPAYVARGCPSDGLRIAVAP